MNRPDSSRFSRRHVLAGLAAAPVAACATPPVAADDQSSDPSSDPSMSHFGLETPSESVHSGAASVDGRYRLTTRLCRYPQLGLAWLWAHALTPEGFFSFVDHAAHCSSAPTPESDVAARYADSAGALLFERSGPVAAPSGASISGSCRAHRTATSQFGPGAHNLGFAISFRPERLYSGLNAGRTEVFGRSHVTLTIDGRTVAFDGPAQFHEQRQSTPRFTRPFAYATLWGEGDSAGTFLFAGQRNEGYLIEGQTPTDGGLSRLDRPGQAQRRLAVALRDGRALEGSASLVQAYTIPIYGRVWRGHMVRVELAGRRYAGHVNDFLGEELTYPGGT